MVVKKASFCTERLVSSAICVVLLILTNLHVNMFHQASDLGLDNPAILPTLLSLVQPHSSPDWASSGFVMPRRMNTLHP